MVKVPLELLRQVDILVKHFGFESREAFVEAAIRRVIDYYSLYPPPLKPIAS